MRRQASKEDLLDIADALGLSFVGEITTCALRVEIRKRLRELHADLAVLYPLTPFGTDVVACQRRLEALHRDADERRKGAR